jgi:rhomboid protease GluP
LWGFGPLLRQFGNDLGFVSLVIYGSVVLYVATLLVSMARGEGIMSGSIFSMLGPSTMTTFIFGASGAVPVFEFGRWWTVLSAGWLHAGLLHIGFNMMWVRQLGPATAEIYGAGRMVIVYTAASASGFLLSSAAGVIMPNLPIIGGGAITLGASAPIFGLLGALVYYGRRGGSSMIRAEAGGYALTLFVFGLIMPGVDNYAHAGGFGGGYFAAMWLDPLKRERMDHFVWASVCLVLTALSIIWSIVTAYL